VNRIKDSAIFFVGLAAVAILVAGGIFYFGTWNHGVDATSGIASTSPMTPQNALQTIPTSTIIIPAASTSSAPAPLSLPYTLKPSTANTTYWPKAWGSISFVNSSIVFVPDPSTHGANSFLNGASSWKNYAVNVDASWLMGGWFDIVSRVSNDQRNFVYCEFGPNGTEVIERVNNADIQIASAAASTTSNENAQENFGMEVYGNDVGCMMNGQEVLGARISQNEVSNGGIGFVIFGQSAAQKRVTLSGISVTPLARETITIPFPAAVAPVASVAPSPALTPAPAPIPVATTTISLPYSVSTFNAADWTNGWGTFSTTGGVLNLGSDDTDTSAGIFLNGSASWTDYRFTAYVKWISGQIFELATRRTDGANLLECIFSEIDSSDTKVSIDMVYDGQTTVINSGQTFNTNAAHMLAIDFPVSMDVKGSNIQCEVDNQTVSATINGNAMPRGGIGFITWDPQQGNSQIQVIKVSVTPL